jgi:hypothetical protein
MTLYSHYSSLFVALYESTQLSIYPSVIYLMQLDTGIHLCVPVASCKFRGARIGTEAGFSSSFIDFLVIITIPPLLDTHPSQPHEVCDSPDQAAQYHPQRLNRGQSRRRLQNEKFNYFNYYFKIHQ